MMHISKNAKNILFNLFALAFIFFLSGCGESQPPQQQVLRDAEQYDIKSYSSARRTLHRPRIGFQ